MFGTFGGCHPKPKKTILQKLRMINYYKPNDQWVNNKKYQNWIVKLQQQKDAYREMEQNAVSRIVSRGNYPNASHYTTTVVLVNVFINTNATMIKHSNVFRVIESKNYRSRTMDRTLMMAVMALNMVRFWQYCGET